MSKAATKLRRIATACRRLWVLLLLAGFGAAGLIIVSLAAASHTPPVMITFVCSTNGGGREIIALEITNRLPCEVWWKVQTGNTNFFGALDLNSNDNINYQSGVWHGVWQCSGEPPVTARSSWRPFYGNPNVRVKSGQRVWLVWSEYPKSGPIPHSTSYKLLLSLSSFFYRHGWIRAGASLYPKSDDPHVEELVAP
jgi:hypothetical protein